MEIYNVGKTAKYKDGVKYRIIVIDPKTKRRVLMDNHHPKGPHIHIDDKEVSYNFHNVDKLTDDFAQLVMEHLEVKL